MARQNLNTTIIFHSLPVVEPGRAIQGVDIVIQLQYKNIVFLLQYKNIVLQLQYKNIV